MNETAFKFIGDKIQHVNRLFPRIAKKICEVWGSDEFDSYINSLVVCDREDRQGFPPEVVSELMALSFLHDEYLREKELGEDPWAFEKEMGEVEITQFRNNLRAQGMDFTPQIFFATVEQGNTRTALDFIRAGMNVDTRRQDQWTPLMVALFHKQEETALMLIKRGANVSAIADRGYQPIHWATLSGYVKATNLLLKKGASANAATDYGWTPLLQAATKGFIEIIKLLLDAKAYVNAVERQGFSALHKACANEHVEIVKLLLANDANPNLLSVDGTTPLTIAEKKRNRNIISLLHAFGARG